jgi:hypothetical protein
VRAASPRGSARATPVDEGREHGGAAIRVRHRDEPRPAAATTRASSRTTPGATTAMRAPVGMDRVSVIVLP